MKVSSLNLSSDISKIIKGKESSDWVTAIDKKDENGEKLIIFLKALIKSDNDPDQKRAIGDQAVQKLSILKLDISLDKQFKKMASKVSKLGTSTLKPMDKSYIPEAVGIPKKALRGKSKRIIHVYKNTIATPFERWKKSDTSEDFGLWIKAHAKGPEKKEMLNNQVQYLKPDEAEKYIVSFHKRKVKQNGQTIKDGNYMYVLDATMQSLFLGIKVKGKFHHPSFTGGTPVACAGRMKLKNGKIETYNLKSGHYKPTEDNEKNLIEFLSEESRLGRDLPKRTP